MNQVTAFRKGTDMNIGKLIKPDSVAVVGVTDRPGSFGCAAAVGTIASSISDRVYYVHPKREMLYERKCYKSLDEIDDVIDCVIICTPRPAVVPILRQAGEKGVKAAIVYASGFAEEHSDEGESLEREMGEICKEYDMALLGPNCAGILNNVDNINLWGLTLNIDMNTRPTGIGIVAQSGFIAQHIMMRDYMNVSYCISSGNGNIVKFEEYFDFLVNDENTKVLALYIEGVKDGRKFSESLKTAAMKRKPVIVLKTGKSAKGAAATASHTGNLAGTDSSFEAVFKKYGVIRVKDLEEFMTTAQMFSVLQGNYPVNNAFCGINLSGGENAICADLCEHHGIFLPDFSTETVSEVEKFLPGFATAQNPLDATTDLFRNKEAIAGIIKAVKKDRNISAVILGTNIEEKASPRMHDFTDALVDAASEKGMFPIFAVPSYEASRNRELRLKLENSGIPLVSGGRSGYSCISYLAEYAGYSHENRTLEISVPEVIPANTKALSEAASKNLISSYGITVPEHILVYSEKDIEKAMQQLKGPYVMKINSSDILHKTDAGGVKLGVRDHVEGAAAYNEIIASCRKYNPDAKLDGVMVQEMLEPGTEMIVGIKNDPTFGPVILVGMGGVFVEVFKDISLYPVPLSRNEALNMLQELNAFSLLSGYRGEKACDIDALCSLIVDVAAFASENRNRIREIDLNPVFVYEKGNGVNIVDALIVEAE